MTQNGKAFYPEVPSPRHSGIVFSLTVVFFLTAEPVFSYVGC